MLILLKKKKKKKRKLKGSIGDDGFKRIEGWFKTIRSWDGYLHLGFGTVRFCPVEGGGGGTGGFANNNICASIVSLQRHSQDIAHLQAI